MHSIACLFDGVFLSLLGGKRVSWTRRLIGCWTAVEFLWVSLSPGSGECGIPRRELGMALIGGLAAVSAGDAVIERVVVCGLFGVFAADGRFGGVGREVGA